MESTNDVIEKTTDDELNYMNFCIDSLLLADQMITSENLNKTSSRVNKYPIIEMPSNEKKCFLFGEPNCENFNDTFNFKNVKIVENTNNDDAIPTTVSLDNVNNNKYHIGFISKFLITSKTNERRNNYIVNYSPNTNPDVIINDLYRLFDPNNQLHNHFKILCDSLHEKTATNENIKNILSNFDYRNDTTVTILFNKLMFRIYNEKLSDFTIIFPNNRKIKCLKAVLLTIPYFEMQFKDTQINDSMDLTSNYNMVKDLIELIHIKNEFDYDSNMIHDSFTMRMIMLEVNVIDYIDRFKLMDEFLMKDHFYILLEYANKNIKSITNDLISKNDYGNLVILYEILKNIAIEQLTNPKDCYFDENSDANKILVKMFQSNMGDKIAMFDGWQQMVDENYKSIAITLKEIHKNCDYDSLNTLDILPRIILSFLTIVNFESNKYYDIFESVESNNATLIFGKKNRTFIDSIIMINSYYPAIALGFHFPELNYIKITKMPISILHGENNCITIQLLDHFNKNIKTNAHIFFGKQLKTLNVKYDYLNNHNIIIDTEYRDFGHYLKKSRNDYHVNSILKCSNNDNIGEKVNEAKYISPLFHNTQYKLLLDRPCDDNVSDHIWLIEHCIV